MNGKGLGISLGLHLLLGCFGWFGRGGGGAPDFSQGSLSPLKEQIQDVAQEGVWVSKTQSRQRKAFQGRDFGGESEKKDRGLSWEKVWKEFSFQAFNNPAFHPVKEGVEESEEESGDDLSSVFSVLGAANEASRKKEKTPPFQKLQPKTSLLSAQEEENLRAFFAAHQEGFQSCYEETLSQGQDYSVVVFWSASLEGGGRLSASQWKVEGTGSPSLKAQLVQCLQNTLEALPWEPQWQGVGFKKQWLFQPIARE